MAAQGECDMMGGYLAEPKTGTEQDFLRSEIQFFDHCTVESSPTIVVTNEKVQSLGFLYSFLE